VRLIRGQTRRPMNASRLSSPAGIVALQHGRERDAFVLTAAVINAHGHQGERALELRLLLDRRGLPTAREQLDRRR
jgi:hypothetical protein